MQSLSKKEVEVIANLEFSKKYFFTRDDIMSFFSNTQQINDFIFGLKKKKRIIKLNKRKYYLIPIKARSGGWSEHPFIIADELCDGKDYVIGGWAAAKYYKLTDQIPAQTDIYSTKKQGKTIIMNSRFIFHRTTKEKINRGIRKEVEGHQFKILPKQEAAAWYQKRR